MAQRTIIQHLDDITGEDGAEQTSFAYGGINYEIDLVEKNRIDLEDALARFIEHARTVKKDPTRPTRRGAGKGRNDKSVIRAWASENGYEIAERGRIPARVVEAYEAASS